MRHIGSGLGLGAGLVAVLLALPAAASDRRFAYTYETAVLNPGDRELEPWTTIRGGRESYYTGFDERIEFEMGLVENLQIAWYLNFGGLTAGTGADRTSSFQFQGVSTELKYKLLDPVADPVGLALYGEVGMGPGETEVEAKVLLDKRFGNVLVAFNAVGEYEWESTSEGLVRELIIEGDLGLAYVLPSGLGLGIELRNHNEYVAGVYEHSALFLGPTLSYASKRWWAAVAVQPQVASPLGATNGGLHLHEHERVEARVLFGWDL